MRKKIMIVICLLLLNTVIIPVCHAAFIPWSLPETSVMSSGALILRPTQTFAYGMEDVPFYGSNQNLYLTSWSGGSSGFHWRRATTTTTIPFVETFGAEGFVDISSSLSGPLDYDIVNDLNTVFVSDNFGNVYILATFYGEDLGLLTKGYYARIYKWDLTGVTYLSTITLSSTILTSPTTYSRISMDVHRGSSVAVVWEVGGVLYMKGLDALSGMIMSPTMTIPSPYRGYIPDIAFGHPSTSYIRARVVYTSGVFPYPTTVIHVSFVNIMASLPVFVLDDVNTDAFLSPMPPAWAGAFASVRMYPQGENLKIDCPDHGENDDWAYVYTTDQSVVKVRGRQASFPVSTIVLTSSPSIDVGVYNQQLAIQFNRNGRIYTGWRTNHSYFSPGQRYVGKVFNFGVLPADYPEISNVSQAFSGIAFSKQDDFAHCLFGSYVYGILPVSPGYDLMYKLKPYYTSIPFSEVKEIGYFYWCLS